MLDPTGELSPTVRQRVPPPASLDGATIGLFSISKERSSEFLDTVERLLNGRGHAVVRYEKPTHTKPSPEAIIQDIVEHCDVVIEGLAD
ncbi:MAG: hypothetical protein K0U93_02935 [Gammaproteobacteria bacterium]|nr:hypothetical protein [Gammaproteobacteria bacterium]